MEKLAFRILCEEKACMNEVAAELEMGEREWVMV